MASAGANKLVLKEDLEVLSKVLRISLAPLDAAAASSASRTSAAEAVVELGELIAELQADAGDDHASAEAVSARFGDFASRRSLFDRALVGRLSSAADAPVADYLIGCFARCLDLKARKGSSASAELVQVLDYVAELCVSYSAIAFLNPSMFPQPADAEAEGVLRLLRPLKDDALPATFLSRLIAKLVEEGTLAELGLPLFAKLAEEVPGAPPPLPPLQSPHMIRGHSPLTALGLARPPSHLPRPLLLRRESRLPSSRPRQRLAQAPHSWCFLGQ